MRSSKRVEYPCTRTSYTSNTTGDVHNAIQNKSLARMGEASLNVAERFSTIVALLGHKYPMEEFRELWKRVLLYHFHDTISGTCIREVYEELQKV